MRLLITACFILFSSYLHALSLNKIVIFGDSLSDTGNFYEHANHLFPPCPPYHNGRFSNGPVWVENLLEYYYPNKINTHLQNYAFAGAGVLPEKIDNDSEVFSLHQQIAKYFNENSFIDENSLFIVEIGTNNYLLSQDAKISDEKFVTSRIKNALEFLATKGIKNIMLVNIPDIGTIPCINQLNTSKLLTEHVKLHNELLYKNFVKLKQHYTEVNWFYLDLYNFIKEIMDNAQSYGFNNITDACYDPRVNYFTSINAINFTHLNYKKANFKKITCNGFLFFDHIHLSEKGHQLVAEKTKSYLDDLQIVFN